ncbi:MAG: DNA polymerase I [Rhodospirillaceae bacterium]|nr:DNA polymerase I [Rhodospirillaceae bacterium]|tara:strand:- start:437 stop:3172 length:2736 start_codon:yes stop_codon:yes gene_type:complete
MADAPKHVYLIDGSGFIFRAFHALPPMTRADGTPVNAVMGFCNMIIKLLDGTDADHIACVFDYSSKTFRNDLFDQYKAHRPPPPEELVPQFPLIREAALAFNLPVIEMEGYEADDIIATYTRMATEAGAEVTIVSSDKDLMQLIGEKVMMLDGLKTKEIREGEVFDKFGVTPDKVIEVQALAGDSVDNVPGVPGIGVKTAAQLINEYGDLETLLERAEEIKQPKRRENLINHAEDARISKKLVTLEQHVPLEEGLETLVRREPEADSLLGFLQSQDFRTVTARAEAWLGQRSVDGPADAPAAEVEQAGYELVQELADLERWIADAARVGVVAVDTETTSVDEMTAELVGVSLSTHPGNGCYIPLAHKASDAFSETPKQIAMDQALAALRPLLADPAVLKVGHNIKYDSVILSRVGVPVSPVDDTMLLSHCLEGGKHDQKMDTLAQLYLGHSTIPYKEVAGSGKSLVTFDYVTLGRARDYAAEDADITLRLWRELKPRLSPERVTTIYETVERPLIPVIAEMEQNGVKVDRIELERMSGEFGHRIQALEKEIHSLAGHPFTIGSPKQLGEVLFDEMGIEGGKKGKSGSYGTGADVLEGLAAQGHALPRKVLDWRQLAKLKSTYTDTLIEQINPETGRVHTSFAMAAASTGRLASSDPNLQNIPIRTAEGRRIRDAFVAEKGNVLLSADYSQIELRLLAHVAGIDTLKQAFHDGLDIHAMTASQVFSVPLDDMDAETRRKAKAINFGIIYGISAFGLANQLSIGRDEARDYIEAYFERYPGIRDYMDRTKKTAKEVGYVETLFGRKCHVTGINDRNPSTRGFYERAAINAPLQGSAADIIKRAMIRVPGVLKEAGLEDSLMLLQVHDELLFEVPEDKADATAACVKEVMEGAATLSVPLTVETGAGHNWNEAH